MKPSTPAHRPLFAALTLAALPALSVAQESTVQLYGAVGVGITYKNNQTGGGHLTEMTNSLLSSSLFGLRGREDLGGGLAAQFRLESGLSTDSGSAGSTIGGSSRFWSRQAFVGLSNARIATLTIGRQFHASTERVIQSLDVYNVAGPSVQTAPIALFGINRYVSNDTRVDDSIKLRLNGPAGVTVGLSHGLDDGAGRSYAFDLAQITPAYTVAVYGVKFRSPTPIAATGARPEHQVLGLGGQLPLGKVTLYLNYAHSSLDATAANRPEQKNRLIVPAIRYDLSPVILKAAYTHDSGKSINNVAGRDGSKKSWMLSAEYLFSKRTSAYVAAFTNRFSGGYQLDPVNIAALSRDPNASSMSGLSIGMRHEF